MRNLSKHVNEAALKRLAFDALRAGLQAKLVTRHDALAHWRAGGELSHEEVAQRAADPGLVVPPLDEKNIRGAIPSVYIDREVVAGKKTADAPSRGFGFIEFSELIENSAAMSTLKTHSSLGFDCLNTSAPHARTGVPASAKQ